MAQLSIAEQLSAAGVTGLDVPEVSVRALDPGAEQDQQRVIVAIIGVGVLYGLLILFGQFVAQGVVEEKSSRVVELLLATMKPWQLLAGKIVGLGLLGLAQIVVIAVVGVAGALAFDLVDIPGDLIGTAVSVVLWFVLGYAFYAAIFAVAASLVSRQEDLAAVIMPTTLVLVVAFIVGIQASADPDGPLAVITSYVPGLSPLVMPVRQAAGDVAVWEIALAVVIMLIAIAVHRAGRWPDLRRRAAAHRWADQDARGAEGRAGLTSTAREPPSLREPPHGAALAVTGRLRWARGAPVARAGPG